MSDRRQRTRMQRPTSLTIPSVDAVSPVIADHIRAEQGGGAPLTAPARANLEAGLGHNFANIRVHTDDEADRLARSVDAAAFTTRSDIFFRAGRYDPTSQAGMHLLAHEAAHVVQQAGSPPSNTVEPGALKLSDPSDVAEHAANRAATDVMLGRPVNPQSLAGASGLAGIQRKETEVDLDFLPSGSDVTFTPIGYAFSPATKDTLAYTDFPDGTNGEIDIDADTKGIVRLGLKIHIFEDNLVINERLDQSVFVDWNVAAARDGKLTIDGSPKIWRGAASSNSVRAGLADINPSAGADFVMINPVIASAGGSSGVSIGVGWSANTPGQSVSMPFTLKIVVKNIPPPKEPTGTVTIGEVSAQRMHEVLFPAPNGGKGQFLVPNEEITGFSIWYSSLSDTTRERIEKGELAVQLTAYTSTTGDVAYNEWLSDERRNSVEQLLRRKAGSDARIERSRALGKLETPTPDQEESAEWRKVVISVFDVMLPGENKPVNAAP